MKNTERRQVLDEFFQLHPDLNPIGNIESGNRGFAIQLSDGRHLKLTLDTTEAEVSKTLLGRKNKHLCDIFEVGEFYSRNQEIQYTWIIMEHLYKVDNQEWINDAFNNFRHSWFSLYPPRPTTTLSWSDLWLIYKTDDKDKINKTRQLLVEYIKNINKDRLPFDSLSETEIADSINRSLLFFDFFYEAYKELLSVCPLGRIDLNEGNFMFDVKGNIKVLDIQSEDRHYFRSK